MASELLVVAIGLADGTARFAKSEVLEVGGGAAKAMAGMKADGTRAAHNTAFAVFIEVPFKTQSEVGLPIAPDIDPPRSAGIDLRLEVRRHLGTILAPIG